MPNISLGHTVNDLTALWLGRAAQANLRCASAPLLLWFCLGRIREAQMEHKNMEVGCPPKKRAGAVQVLVVVSSGRPWSGENIAPSIQGCRLTLASIMTASHGRGPLLSLYLSPIVCVVAVWCRTWTAITASPGRLRMLNPSASNLAHSSRKIEEYDYGTNVSGKTRSSEGLEYGGGGGS